MFDSQYRFYGKHAVLVEELTSDNVTLKNAKIFKRVIDVLFTAPLVGFLWKRRADEDRTINPITKELDSKSVFNETIIIYQNKLFSIYQIIMLLDSEYEDDVSKRIDKAFRYAGKNDEDYQRFQSYVRGGVEILHEKLVEDASNKEDFLNNLNVFLHELEVDFDKSNNI